MNTGTRSFRVRLPDIGSLDRRIVIERPVTTANDYNEEVTTWATLATVSARVEVTRTGSTEQFEGDQQVVTTRTLFTIRYRDDFDEKCRIRYDDGFAEKIYDIRNIEPIGRRRFLRLVTENRT